LSATVRHTSTYDQLLIFHPSVTRHDSEDFETPPRDLADPTPRRFEF